MDRPISNVIGQYGNSLGRMIVGKPIHPALWLQGPEIARLAPAKPVNGALDAERFVLSWFVLD
jgi:hypothetical protein